MCKYCFCYLSVCVQCQAQDVGNGGMQPFNFAFQEQIFKNISLRRHLFPLKQDFYKIYYNPKLGSTFPPPIPSLCWTSTSPHSLYKIPRGDIFPREGIKYILSRPGVCVPSEGCSHFVLLFINLIDSKFKKPLKVIEYVSFLSLELSLF